MAKSCKFAPQKVAKSCKIEQEKLAKSGKTVPLQGINYKPVPSYPVGYEKEIPMFPFDFEEFLWANGVSEQVFDVLREAYCNETPVPDFIHQQMSQYYRQFLAVDGMPEAVQTFVNNPD